ncbi:MAG: hypothetical protein DCC58_13705 [Chloroflexi bacterium]|nr:MAG: hypothetical protein DCC58_13705 [Chloroflexota bacterium]
MVGGTGCGCMSDAFERIDASWQTLLAALHGVPDAACEQPNAVGAWSIKDVLGHVAFWKGAIAQRAERAVAGGALDDGSGPGERWHVTNEREAARRATWTL